MDPDFDEFSEENPQDIREGECFAAEVINRVMHGKGWPDTLLIWTYDENGGYYDHVPPPAAVPPTTYLAAAWSPTGPGCVPFSSRCFPATSGTRRILLEPLAYDTYGFRVPAVIMSPYAHRTSCCPRSLTTPRC